MPTKKPVAGRSTVRPQDAAISDVERGVTTPLAASTFTEDQKRAMGIDASQAEGAGEHDDSPEARAGQQPGGTVIDSYAGAPQAEHGNYAGPGIPVALGQAPQAPTQAMAGSPNADQKFDPRFQNPCNQSPVIRGRETDPRNDPAHPGFVEADPTHPDYGRPAMAHKGRRTSAPSFNDLRVQAAIDDAKGEQDDADDAAGKVAEKADA